MKGRYGVIFWASLGCLISLTWVSSRFGMSSWDLVGLHLITMSGVCIAAITGTRPEARPRAPAIVALLLSLPTLSQTLLFAPKLIWATRLIGVPFVLMFVTSLTASGAALVVAVMPPARPKRAPVVPEARIVARMSQEDP